MKKIYYHVLYSTGIEDLIIIESGKRSPWINDSYYTYLGLL